jgi:hypothetical protein
MTTKGTTLVWSTIREEERTRKTRTETEVTGDAAETTGGSQKIEGNSLVLLQVNCRSILNKSLEFWNLIDVCMYVCSGAGFPMHCDLYVVYCTSPVNFKSADIPSRRDGTARPTYQRTAEPSPWRRN